jgi:DNA uptake protein ComE-like DNA-binding protein
MRNIFLKKYFDFSKHEQNGLIVLFVILIGAVVTKIYLIHNENVNKNFEIFENDISRFESSQTPEQINVELFLFDPNTATLESFEKLGFSSNAINSIMNYRNKGGKFYKPEDLEKIYTLTPEEYETVKDYILITSQPPYKKFDYKFTKYKDTILFDFDPNTADAKTFKLLGLKSWQISNINKYKEKGGVFKHAKDFAKIYGIDTATFANLEPFIKIDANNIASNHPKNNIVKQHINLNNATQTELQTLKSITPTLSQKIIEHRDNLGGYINVEQLFEIHEISEEIFNNIKELLSIDINMVNKININKAKYKDLISHPYIDKNNANAILNYRNFAKKIKSFEELLSQKAIDIEFYNKLKPYISIE